MSSLQWQSGRVIVLPKNVSSMEIVSAVRRKH
ncbi:hypothetical protein [Leptospira brenneri]|uniref:Uncharacterized protein n=1 Tax=Leptospira brenneri TaxID=2023182 RepID=A0A5F1Z8S3_9LEPT|nr:hypothetical protein EHQ30_04985 [Leptospira brenneri]